MPRIILRTTSPETGSDKITTVTTDDLSPATAATIVDRLRAAFAQLGLEIEAEIETQDETPADPEPDTAPPPALADTEWRTEPGAWSPAGQTTTFQARIRIDAARTIDAAQWTTSPERPARADHWETLARQEDGSWASEMLHPDTGDWHLFQKDQPRTGNLRIRYRTHEDGAWSDESAAKEVQPPAAETAPDAGGETDTPEDETPADPAPKSDNWCQFMMMSEAARLDPKKYIYPGGGFHRQYFHGGDSSPVNPDHAMLVMDVHGPWVVPNATAKNPGLYTPAGIGIGQRNGVSVKFDPEIEKRAIIAVTAASGGAAGAGLYLTEDLGETTRHVLETAIPGGSSGGYNAQYRAWRQLISYDRDNPAVWLFAVPQYGAGIGAVFRSTDRGRTWAQVSTAPRAQNMGRIFVLQQRADGDFIICGENGLFISSDRGATWKKMARPQGLPDGETTGLALDPKNAGIAYIAVYGKGVFRTEDGFKSVHASKRVTGLFCAVFAHPLDFDNVWAIGLNRDPAGNIRTQQSQFSRDGGAKWQRLVIDAVANGWDMDRTGYQNANVPGFHASRKEMQGGVIPLMSGPEDALLHFSTKHFKTNGDGARGDWAGLSADTHGSGEANWGNVIFSPINPERFMIGAFDEGFFETVNAGRSFKQVHRGNGGAGGNAGGQSGGYSASVEERFIGTSGDYTSHTAPVHRRSPGGALQPNPLFIRDATGGMPRYTFASYSPAKGGGDMIATNHYVSENNGATWTDLRNQSGWPGGGYMAQVCLMSRQDPAVIYAVNDAMTGLWRSDNFGRSWRKYVDFGRSLSANAQPGSLAIDPFDHDVILWWVQGEGLKRFDGERISTGFQDVKAMRTDRVRASAVIPGLIYIWRRTNGGDGVWRSTDGGRTVENVSRNMPRSHAVRSIEECPWTGILFMVGTIGPRYLAPPTINARCADRLKLYAEIMRDPRLAA